VSRWLIETVLILGCVATGYLLPKSRPAPVQPVPVYQITGVADIRDSLIAYAERHGWHPVSSTVLLPEHGGGVIVHVERNATPRLRARRSDED
jgi:hypothetical protein